MMNVNQDVGDVCVCNKKALKAMLSLYLFLWGQQANKAHPLNQVPGLILHHFLQHPNLDSLCQIS